jgi:uncharacterized membrane protein YdbT with pleckstrin-like domain
MSSLFSSNIPNPSYVTFMGEDKDEYCLYLLRRHIITNVPWILMALLFAAAPYIFGSLLGSGPFAYLAVYLNPGFIFSILVFWYLFIFGFIFTNYLTWYYNTYIISSKRVLDIDVHHFFYKDMAEAMLTSVEDIKHNVTGFWAIIFHFGTITIQTAGERREFEFELVSNPIKIQDIISDLVQEAKANATT